MKKTSKTAEENQNAPKNAGGAKWISRLFLLFSVGLLLYVSFLCYPTWPSSMKQAIENPENTSFYKVFSDFNSRLREGNGVLSAFSETYHAFTDEKTAD